MIKEYALYKREEILAFGTIDEIARKLEVKRDTVKFYKTDAYKRRLNKRAGKGINARFLVSLD